MGNRLFGTASTLQDLQLNEAEFTEQRSALLYGKSTFWFNVWYLCPLTCSSSSVSLILDPPLPYTVFHLGTPSFGTDEGGINPFVSRLCLTPGYTRVSTLDMNRLGKWRAGND